jgi:hypothetical protein
LDPDLPDTILKEDHPRTIVTKFGFNWPSIVRGADLWMKSLRRTDDGKWWQKLTLATARWAKKSRQGQICQIARILKFKYPTQRSCGGHNVCDQSESPSIMFFWAILLYNYWTEFLETWWFLRTWHEDMRIDRKFRCDYFSRSNAPFNL